jgi:hypothetical protein
LDEAAYAQATPEPALREFTLTASEFDWDLMFDAPVGLDEASGALAEMSSLAAIKPLVVP